MEQECRLSKYKYMWYYSYPVGIQNPSYIRGYIYVLPLLVIPVWCPHHAQEM